jgi:Rad3-related DNA helicase
MKGRGNYLCKHKLYALRDSPLLSGLDEISPVPRHRRLGEDHRDRRPRRDRRPAGELRAVAQTRRARRGLPRPDPAPTGRTASSPPCDARRSKSEIVIVNHHLFFADMAIKLQAGASADAGVLPAAGAVIFDEAHELEEIASNFFGINLSTQRFDELARDVETMLRARHASTPPSRVPPQPCASAHASSSRAALRRIEDCRDSIATLDAPRTPAPTPASAACPSSSAPSFSKNAATPTPARSTHSASSRENSTD